jgi:hypothetical protein
VRDPRRDIGQLRLAVQHRGQHQGQDARQGMPPPAPAPGVRDGREAARHALAGRLAQLRRPLQQDPARLIGLGAQPLFSRPLLFPPLSGFPVASGLPAPLRFRLPGPPPLPCLLPRDGKADDLLRFRDHRLGGVSGDGHAKLVTQRGLPAGEEM